MKKQFFLIAVLFAFVLCGHAQQRPHYTQYILNNYILNPALSGIENYTDVKISGRNQWVGLNGAPQTFYLTVHGPLGKQNYRTTPTSYAMPGENPRGSSYWESYTASPAHHGVGLTLLNDKTGLFSRFSANVSYAYHLGLNARTNFSAGFSGGIGRIGYNASKAQFADPNDPVLALNSGIINKIRPDLNIGLWLYSADYFVGLSAQQVIPQKFRFTDDAAYGSKLIPHFFATAGYRFLVTNDINAIPSVMVKYVEGSPTKPQVDLNMKLQYHDLLWLGGGYRYKDGYTAMVGMNVLNTFNIGYSYDFTNTPLNTVSRGTHELILGFLIGNKYSEACPRCW